MIKFFFNSTKKFSSICPSVHCIAQRARVSLRDSKMSERPPHWREICVLHSKVNGSNTLLSLVSSFIAYLTTDIHLLKLVMLLSVICPSSSCPEYFACNTTAAKNIYTRPSLFINRRFALNKMFQRNASKFAIFHV